MNKFKLEAKKYLDSHEYYINIFVDDDNLLEDIDNMSIIYFKALKNSTKKEGLYLIFTCECGIADCGRWDYVKVSHTNNKVIWEFYHLNKDYYFEFDKDSYINEIKQINYQYQGLIDEPQFVEEPRYSRYKI